jgi:hypothetical protein
MLTLALMALLAAAQPPMANAAARAKAALLKKHGEAARPRIERGVDQVAARWRKSDGDDAAFVKFMEDQFVADPAQLDTLLGRFEYALEQLDGHLLEVNRELSRWTVLDLGPMIELDKLLGAYDAGAHKSEDLFESKVAFVALANFPLFTLSETLEKGPSWSRQQWAEARLTRRFDRRVPAEVQQGIAQASADAELYIAEYNVWMHHLLGANGTRPFPKGLKLISHWNLRDELKSQYANKDGLERQQLVARVMERIVTQTIPAVVINNPTVRLPRWTARLRSQRASSTPRASRTRATRSSSPPSTPRAPPIRTHRPPPRTSCAASSVAARCPRRACARSWRRSSRRP